MGREVGLDDQMGAVSAPWGLVRQPKVNIGGIHVLLVVNFVLGYFALVGFRGFRKFEALRVR